MKIAVLIDRLDIRGGTHKQVLRLCEYLRRIDADYAIFTLSYVPNMTYAGFSDHKIVSLLPVGESYNTTVPSGMWGKIKASRRFRSDQIKLLQLIPADFRVINIHDNGLMWLLHRVCNDKEKVVVWQINDLPSDFRVGNVAGIKDSPVRLARRALYKSIARKIDKITVNVTKNRDLVSEKMSREAAVLYCGIDELESAVNTDGNECEIKRERFFRILSIGVFFPYRNYESLISAVEQLVSSGRRITLDIVGNTQYDPIYSGKIESIVQEKGLERWVKIWGQVDDRTLRYLQKRAGAFAFVNVNQSWGLAVFEAMSAGIPVIVSNSVGAVELLHDHEDSLIVDPFNIDEICGSVELLIDDSDFHERLSRNGLELVKEYSWEKSYCAPLVDMISKLVEDRRLE